MCRPNLFLLLILWGILFYISSAFSDEGPGTFQKTALDIERKYTRVGNIGLTVTNFGTIGTRNAFWPRQPSCEYPRGSRIEHIYQGGLWVGALMKTQDPQDIRNNQYLVSTGTSDQFRRQQGLIEGYEFNAEKTDSIIELSSLTDDRPPESQYSPLAVSHQDFICTYSDRFTRVPATGDSIYQHLPLGIRVHQESYAYNFPFADFFVILKYLITNTSRDTLDSVYVGIWNNAVVRNTNLVRPGSTQYFIQGAHGYDSLHRMAYSFDYSEAQNNANSYVGLKLLGTTPFPSNVDSLPELCKRTYYNAWRFRGATGQIEYHSPAEDHTFQNRYLSRYSRLTASLERSFIDPLRLGPGNYTYLLSTGPFSRLGPGDSVEVVFAVVTARKSGSGRAQEDTPAQRKDLYSYATWAQKAYNGEDVNGNGKLDCGLDGICGTGDIGDEDIARRDSVSPSVLGLRFEPDGKLTRYLLPTPPRPPKVRVEVENQSIILYWDSASAQNSIDPISGNRDFEGYRIYRSITGSDFLMHEDFLVNIPLIAEFDKAGNQIGYNTGFGTILLDSAKVFPGDTVEYWYRFPPKGVEVKYLNGWQYVFGVSAFDSGDAALGVPILESTKVIRRVIPGTRPTSDENVPIIVYPNPYYVNAYWDGGKERLRKIYFANLPPRCEIRIYTLAGDVVAVLEHDADTYNGSGIEWFEQFGDRRNPAQFAGGEHAWDLITKHDQAIASGLYLFTVEDKQNGKVKRGKFMIIK